ncbi:MAG: hypothetical protein QG670_2911 [Thermoproteota archaeon]|nr:hypothetical protein [Thermoproteota archaeon]
MLNSYLFSALICNSSHNVFLGESFTKTDFHAYYSGIDHCIFIQALPNRFESEITNYLRPRSFNVLAHA